MKRKKTLEISLKNIICFILAICIVYYGGMKIWAATVETTPITFSDNNLYQSLKTRLSKYIIDKDDAAKTLEIRTDAMTEITQLDLSNCQISDLSGIEKFTSLVDLNLSKNTISDISDLSNLGSLKTLNLSNNTINNINNISALTTLTNLNLNSNKISDITPISKLINLQVLDVSNNAISTAVAVRSLPNLTSLNVSQNSSLGNLSDVLMSQLTALNISSTAITNIENITTCRNLIELNIANNNISSLTPLFATEKLENETVAILRNLQKLDVGYTTKSGLTFSNLKKITALKELYAQGNELTSVSGIAEMGELEYVNLDDNNIENIDPFRTTTTQNGIEVTKDLLKATQISLANNEIEDISVLSYLERIEYLNLAGNHIQVIAPIEKFEFSKGVDLRNQTITMPIYEKKNNENHYVILLNIMQSAKDEDSIAYAENANFTTEGVTLNTDPTYTVSPYYNVIITPDKTDEDILSITLHGGIADGTKITFQISGSSSAIETLQFEDPNLDAAIYKYLLTHMSENSYIARAPKIINITQREIANTKELDISNAKIQNLKGLSNFSKLEVLNLSNNEISDDSEIKYLEDLMVLNFANNKLNNQYTSIETLYELTNLDLSGNNIQDLNSLNNYLTNLEANRKQPKLTELTLSNNKLTNIEILYNLSTLQRLNISNNAITDINYISPNKSLNTLNISGNDIEDVTVLSELTSIKTLNMSNNLIEDIQSITNLSLTTLDISGNRITDITPIRYQTGLTDLYMNNNKIADVSSIESLLLRGTFEAKQQKLTKVLDSSSGTITVPLPEIFKSAKNSSSKVYTTNEFSLENCTLSSDGNSIEINTQELGENKIARVTIVGGQADGTTFSVADALKGTITYNPQEKTKGNVVATISFNRDGAKILNNDGKNTYTFTQNGDFTFIYQDEYGFDGETKATVNWIDNKGPVATVSYSIEELTNQDVEVTITTDEAIGSQVNGWEFTNDNHTEMKKTYSKNTEETITLQDELGNTSEVKIAINNIDKTAPQISGVENGKTYEESVKPNVTDENLETVTLTKDGSKVTNYTNGQEITENGQYTLTATDKAGNETVVEFTIEKEELDDTITSSDYEVDMETLKISRISPETKASDFKSHISTEVGYKIENLSGQEIQNGDFIGTGYTLVTDTGKEYTLIVTGDLNGDGEVKLTDVSMIRKHYLEVETLQGIYEEAADIDNNGNISLNDISMMRKFILGVQKI